MRNSNEISRALEAKMAELQSANAEQRAALGIDVENLTKELQEAQIDEAARRALANQRVLTPAEKKELKRFSISKFLREAAAGRLSGFEAEMNEEAMKEMNAAGRSLSGYGIPSFLMRDYSYTNASETGKGAAFPVVGQQTYAEALLAQTIANKLGVTFMNGLRGNVQIIRGGGATASWAAEEGAVAVTKPNYGTVTLSPKRLEILNGFTYDLLHQSSLAVDAIIMNEMSRKHAEALDKAILSGAGTSGEPSGIVSAATAVTGTLSWAKVVELETTVGTANGLAGNLAYVANPAVNGSLKTTEKSSGYPLYLAQDGKINGYNLEVSTGAGANLIFGDFSQVICAGWGGLDFVVDPFTAKNKGVIEVAAIAYHDVAVKQPAAFAAIKSIS